MVVVYVPLKCLVVQWVWRIVIFISFFYIISLLLLSLSLLISSCVNNSSFTGCSSMKASYNILFSITRYCYDITLFMHTASDLYGKVSKLFTIFIFKLLNSFLNFNVKFFENKKQINYKKTIPKTIPKYYIEGGITIYLPNCIKLSIN